jgi:predicted NBD/HSP70 family sugar kinase
VSTYRAVPLTRRAQHEERLLHLLRERGALSRAEIADELRVSRATLSEVAGGLLRRGAVVVHETDARVREGSGRPAERLALDPASGQFLGVDMGHRRTRVAVSDAGHTVLAENVAEYDPDTTGVPERIAITFALIARVTEGRRLHLRALQGIGIGVPGPFSARPEGFAGRVARGQDRKVSGAAGGREAVRGGAGPDRSPAALSELGPAELGPGGYPRAWVVGDQVRQAFEERFGVPVLLGNNTRFAALAEAAAIPGEPVRDLVYVRLSEGVGGGLVIGGHLAGGWAGAAGEFGHVCVQPGGRLCRCGRSGCLETVASVPAVLRALAERGLGVPSLADVRPGDLARESVLREAAEPLGRLLAVHATTLNPAEIVIGGELGTHPAVLQQVSQSVSEHLGVFAVAVPRVRAARLADDDGCLGALTALYQHGLIPLTGQETAASTPRGETA